MGKYEFRDELIENFLAFATFHNLYEFNEELKEYIEATICEDLDLDEGECNKEIICENLDLDEEECNEIYDEAYDRAIELLKKDLKNIVDNLFEKYKEYGEYNKIAFVIGVQHINIPFKYYLSYVVLSELMDNEEDVYIILKENGVPPHAWGIGGNSWGNYYIVILDKDKIDEIDDENLVVIVSQFKYNNDNVKVVIDKGDSFLKFFRSSSI